MVTVSFNNICQIGCNLEAIEKVVTLGTKNERSVDFSAYQSMMVSLRKILMQLFELKLKCRHFFYATPFHWITRVIETLIFGRHFLQNKRSEPSHIKKKLTIFVANDKIRALKQKVEFWKIRIWFLILKTFLMRLMVVQTNVTFFNDIMKNVNI